ncbi:GDSL-type esterase/lipase family protein [Planomicrobium sp. CPCC 101110]|uniref:GDSL-type esterase/lipase family protein n=1 Tax=Planomicrobium sp. CPCC 101110 TaxID=2599619 RepID=UPI0011B45635|nr:GDSL-type esterase/lipase family protein [Planomicrobium sp. CPCC 101110]TWT25709.1 GDSL family lipase [Planomicrobium sp. CPCC 101110]
MKRILFILIAVMVFLAGCNSPFIFGNEEAEPRIPSAFSAYTVPPNFVPQALLVTAIGDSLSQGVGDEKNIGGYVGRLTQEMREWPGVQGAVVENTAKRGRRSDQLLAMFQQGELTGPVAQADYVVMTIGGNDVMRIVKRDLFSLTVEAFKDELILYENRYRTIFSSIRSINPTVPVIVLGIYNPFSLITRDVKEFEEIIAEYNSSMQEVAETDPQACFVPVNDLFMGNDNLVYHTDFFHPNSKGYDLMAERIFERMEECGFSFQE